MPIDFNELMAMNYHGQELKAVEINPDPIVVDEVLVDPLKELPDEIQIRDDDVSLSKVIRVTLSSTIHISHHDLYLYRKHPEMIDNAIDQMMFHLRDKIDKLNEKIAIRRDQR